MTDKEIEDQVNDLVQKMSAMNKQVVDIFDEVRSDAARNRLIPIIKRIIEIGDEVRKRMRKLGLD